VNENNLRPGQLCRKVLICPTGGKAPDSVEGWERHPDAPLHFFDNAIRHYITREDILLLLERHNDTWAVVLHGTKKVYIMFGYLEAL